MQAPGFWDEPEAAQRTATAHKRARDRLETFRALEADAADLDELAEMAADDPEIAAELGPQLESVEAKLSTLEVARLVTDWAGQGPIDLPGCRARRVGAMIEFTGAEAGTAARFPASDREL